MLKDIDITVPNSAEASALVERFGLDTLMSWSADALANPSEDELHAILPLLHTAANELRAKGEHDGARRFFEEILKHFDRDPNVRFSLAQYAAMANDEPRIYELLAPVLSSVMFYSEANRDIFGLFCRAAFARSDFQAVRSTLAQSDLLATGDETALAIAARLGALEGLGLFEAMPPDAGAVALDAALFQVLSALDERTMRVTLAAAQDSLARQPAVSAFSADLIVLCIIIAREARWGRPFRAACRLAAAATAVADDPAVILAAARARAFPERFLDALGLLAINSPGLPDSASERTAKILDVCRGIDPARYAEGNAGHSLETAVAQCKSARDIGSAQAAWSAACDAARFDLVLKYVPGARLADPVPDQDDMFGERIRIAASVHRPPPAPDEGPAIWFFITWHEDPENLFRLYNSLYREKNKYVVSIGGSRPLEQHSILSPLILFGGIHLLYRPSVSWGGQKLLYYNLFEVLECFGQQAGEESLFQIICNRTYPLATPSEFARMMGTPKHREIFARRLYSIPPPAWNHEWPQETVDDLPEIFDSAVENIFTNADATSFVDLATFPLIYDASDYRLDQSAFNFAREPIVFEGQLRGVGQSYTISAHAADHRWMSFGRLMAFTDVLDESGATYSRRMHPKIIRWVHSVLAKHDLRTGDPFVLMTHKFIQTLLADKDCNELFAAMDLGFGPEMNYFDTISYSKQYDLAFDLSHQYFRTATNSACEADIADASYASDVLKLVFMRKMIAGISAPFIAEFAARIDEDRPADRHYLSVAAPNPVTPLCLPPTFQQLFRHSPIGLQVTLRDLRGRPRFVGRFEAEGALVGTDGTPFDGRWSLGDGGLVLDGPQGRKVYDQIASDGRKLILPPSEIVSMRNAWSLFVEIDLAAFAERYRSRDIVVDAGKLPAGAAWFGSSSPITATLLHFEDRQPADYPAMYAQPAVEMVEARRTAGALTALLDVDGFPALVDLAAVTFANGKIVRVFDRGTAASLRSWEDAPPVDLRTAFTVDDVPAEFWFETLHVSCAMVLSPDGRVTIEGAEAGRWFAEPGAVWIFGLPRLMVARATEFRFDGRAWTLAGWGQSTLHKVNSFRACQVALHGRHGRGTTERRPRGTSSRTHAANASRSETLGRQSGTAGVSATGCMISQGR